MIDVAALRSLWRVNRAEFWISITALVGVLVLGILKDVLLAAVESLLYINADYVRQVVSTRITATRGLELVVCDLSDAPIVDVAGARMLSALYQDMANRGAHFRIVGAHAPVRDLLRAIGLEERAEISAAIHPSIRPSPNCRQEVASCLGRMRFFAPNHLDQN